MCLAQTSLSWCQLSRASISNGKIMEPSKNSHKMSLLTTLKASIMECKKLDLYFTHILVLKMEPCATSMSLYMDALLELRNTSLKTKADTGVSMPHPTTLLCSTPSWTNAGTHMLILERIMPLMKEFSQRH